MINLLFDNIKKYRKELGFSQNELQKISHVGRRTLQNMENEHDLKPYFITIYKIAKALDISIDDLVRQYQPLGYDQNKLKELELVGIIKSLSFKQKNEALKLLKDL